MTLHYRGRCRLMLRIPAWRAELRDATDSDFLEICEAYELAWRGVMASANSQAGGYADEYREMADWREVEALSLALFDPQPVLGMTVGSPLSHDSPMSSRRTNAPMVFSALVGSEVDTWSEEWKHERRLPFSLACRSESAMRPGRGDRLPGSRRSRRQRYSL